MERKLSIAILIIFLIVAICSGQEQSLVPVSPAAAALTKMVDYPINLSTGVPDISIPLYEIKVGKLSLPVTLQYHAGGFKINEKHTREGLGWSLSCELQITRTINGSDDFGPNGYATSSLITSNPFSFYSPQELFPGARKYRMATGEIDGQPDKFTYKLLGKSGSFFVLKNSSGTSYSFVPVPSDNIKIELIGKMFVITDTDGTVYHFQDEETTGSGTDYRITSWKCTRIVDNLGIEVVSFEYTAKAAVTYKTTTDCIEYHSAHSYNEWNFNSTGGYFRSDQTPLSTYTEYTTPNTVVPFYRISNPKYIQYFANSAFRPRLYVPYYDNSTNKLVDKVMQYNTYDAIDNPYNSSFTVNGLALSRIIFRGGKVDFTGTEQLTRVQVSDASNQAVKTILFYHSLKAPVYQAEAKTYNGYNFNGTMYLDSIKMGVNANMYENYAFLYNEKFCYGNHLIGHDAWGFPNLTTREKAYPTESFAVPSKKLNETYYFDLSGFSNSYRENLSYATAGSDWSLYSNADAMRKGVLKRIVYPTGGFVDFDFEANSYRENFPIYEIVNHELPQLCGGLRIRSISHFEKGEMSPVSQKYYTYGEYEEGTGEMANRPKFNYTGYSRNTEAVDVVQYIANWRANCDGFFPCNDRSVLNFLSIEKKTTLYPASILNYTYANGSPVYYTKVTEYAADRGISSGKKVYTFYPPHHFYPYYNEFGRIPETLISYIKTNLFLGTQKSVSEFEFTPPAEWKLKRRKTFAYREEMRNPEIPVAYSTFRVLHEVKIGGWPHQHVELYNDNYPISEVDLFELGGEYTYGNYGIPVGTLLLQTETEECFENGDSTVTTTDYTYRRLQPVEIKTTNSTGERYTKYLTYSFDLDGVYDQMEAKNMLSQVIQERVVNTTRGTEVMRKKTSHAVKTDNGGILPHTDEVSYNGEPLAIENTYDKYDQYGNVLQLTGKDRTPVSYLWGYQGLYPVAQLKGVPYTQIPVRFLSNVNITNPGTDAQLRSLLYELKDSFPGQEQVSGYTYKKLTGLSSRFDERGIVTFYEYDPYGRLTSVKDHNGKSMESHTYHMLNASTGSLMPFWVNTPLITTIYDDAIAYERSYNAIMPGGQVSDLTSTETSNMTAEYMLKSGYGIHLYPDENETIPTTSIKLFVYYYSLYNLSFPARIDVDLVKEGNVVYSAAVPFNDLSNPAPLESITLHIPPGDYQISVRPDSDTRYEEYDIPFQYFRELRVSQPAPVENFATVTLEAGKDYELMITGSI